MFGLFFEDINFAADDGLYPERVRNRPFEFDEPLDGWRKPFRQEVNAQLITLVGSVGPSAGGPMSQYL